MAAPSGGERGVGCIESGHLLASTPNFNYNYQREREGRKNPGK